MVETPDDGLSGLLVLSALMAFCFYLPPYITLNDVSIIGAFGVFPAAVCSWLSSEKQRGA